MHQDIVDVLASKVRVTIYGKNINIAILNI